LDICACDALWDSAHIIDENIQIIKEKVGTDQVEVSFSICCTSRFNHIGVNRTLCEPFCIG
jgi:hypothetical protein